MVRRHPRHRLPALPTVALVFLASCGSGDADDAAASVPAQAEPAIDAADPDSSDAEGAAQVGPNSADPDAGTAACVLDEVAVSAAIGVDVITIGDCDFAAGAAAGEAVTWSVELYVDPTLPEALEGGTPVEGLGDMASWDDALGVLSVRAGDRYFRVQPLRLGSAPITLAPQELAQAVAEAVLDRS